MVLHPKFFHANFVVVQYYIYLFHPRYLHNDIFRYLTREISHDISWHYLMAVLSKLITRATALTWLGINHKLISKLVRDFVLKYRFV